MNKEQIAENLIRIKALKDALDNEIKTLRELIDVGEKIETTIGDVHHIESSRTSYDEKGLLNACRSMEIDPNLIGDVVVKVNRKKFADAITKGKIPASLVEDFSETKEVPTLRIKPNLKVDSLKESTMERVASVIKG